MKNVETCFGLCSNPNIILFKTKRLTHNLITHAIAVPQYKEPLPDAKLIVMRRPELVNDQFTNIKHSEKWALKCESSCN